MYSEARLFLLVRFAILRGWTQLSANPKRYDHIELEEETKYLIETHLPQDYFVDPNRIDDIPIIDAIHIINI